MGGPNYGLGRSAVRVPWLSTSRTASVRSVEGSVFKSVGWFMLLATDYGCDGSKSGAG